MIIYTSNHYTYTGHSASMLRSSVAPFSTQPYKYKSL